MTEDLEQKLEQAVECVEQLCRIVECMEKLLHVVIEERDAALAYIQAVEAMAKAAKP